MCWSLVRIQYDLVVVSCVHVFSSLSLYHAAPIQYNCVLYYPDRSANATHEVINVTLHTTLAATTKLVVPTPAKPILPVQTGVQAQQEEQSSGMTIFFSLLVLGE